MITAIAHNTQAITLPVTPKRTAAQSDKPVTTTNNTSLLTTVFSLRLGYKATKQPSTPVTIAPLYIALNHSAYVGLIL